MPSSLQQLFLYSAEKNNEGLSLSEEEGARAEALRAKILLLCGGY